MHWYWVLGAPASVSSMYPRCLRCNVTQQSHQRQVELVLVARRSRKRAGVRYSRRGVDAEGNVANFAETEQIIMLGSEPAAVSGAGRGSGSGTEKGRALASGVSSFVCLRGSIPLFWKQELSDWTQIKPKLSLASNLPIEAQDPPPSPVCPEKSPSQQGGGEGGGSAAAQHTECAGGNAASPVSRVSSACCTTLQSFFHPSTHPPIHPSSPPPAPSPCDSCCCTHLRTLRSTGPRVGVEGEMQRMRPISRRTLQR